MSNSGKNLIAHIANDFISGNNDEVVDVITFAEAAWGLKLNLLPSQKFILKCVSGDNIIIGHDGVPCTVRDFCAQSHESVMTYDESDGKIKRVFHQGVWNSGDKEVYRIETKLSKRWIEVTGDHRILTPSGYKKAEELSKGDIVVCSAREPFADGDSGLSDWMAGLLGLMIGDGSCSHSGIGLVVAHGQERIRDYFENCVLRLDENMVFRTRKGAGCNIVFASRPKGWDRNTKSMLGVFLESHGILGKTCHNKRVPKDVFGASESSQAEFLRCLFATDGGIAIQHGKTVGISLIYTSVNRDLIDDIRIILRRFGIRSTVEKLSGVTNFGQQKAWQIKINSVGEIRNFLKEIGTPIGWDERYAEAWPIIRERKSFSHLDSLPKELRKLAKEVRKRFRKNGGKIPDTAPSTIRAQTTGKKMMKALGDWTGDPEARRAGESDICWDKVQCIKLVGKKDVYDIAVPKTHNFLIGGIVVHNCYYGMELDDINKTIEVPDLLNEKILYRMTELEFLDFLYSEGRCNTNEIMGKNFHELVLVVGRRGTKSTLASCVSNYELYKLVKRGDPSGFFNFPANTIISILNVAPTDEQAGQVFNMIQNQALGCPYLRDRSLHQTMSYFDIQTDADRKMVGKPRASLVSVAGGCASNGLRGRNAIVVIMDEMAFFIDKENSRFSGAEVYKALTPSMSSFGEHGKVLCLSSPYGKFGRFYERYQESFEEPEFTLMFKMYTSMANPMVPSSILRAAFRRDRTGFMCEYGGEFSDRITAWIESEEEFRKCVKNRAPNTRGKREHQYFIGIDLGFKNDGAAIAIVHKEGTKIILDYADVWFSGESDVWEMDDSIYHGCDKYKGLDLLKMADIVNEVKALSRWFSFKHGMFDQAGGWGFQELMVAAGFSQIEMKHFSDTINNDVYQLTKRLYGEGLLDIYEHPVLVPEMLSLEATKKGKGKVIVEAPDRAGAHDDISDAYVRAVWSCYQHEGAKPGRKSTGAGGTIGPTRGPRTREEAVLQKRKQHGEHPRGLDRLKRRRPGGVRR